MASQQSRRQYSKQFKVDAVELVIRSEKSTKAIAEDLGIRIDLLYRWKYQYQAGKNAAFRGSENLKDTEADQIRKLERKLRSVKEEREILKKALAVFSRTKQ
jgi:transposase